jgi:hypothetical protein
MNAASASSSTLPDNIYIVPCALPANETPEQRAVRIDAADVSRRIDEALRIRKQFLEKRKAAVKILLLGGSPRHVLIELY